METVNHSSKLPSEEVKLISKNVLTRSAKYSQPLALCPRCSLMNPDHQLCARCGQNLMENEKVKFVSQRTFQETFQPKLIKVEIDSTKQDSAFVPTKRHSSPLKTENLTKNQTRNFSTTVKDKSEVIEKKLRIISLQLDEKFLEHKRFTYDITNNQPYVKSGVSLDDTIIEETFVNSQLRMIHLIQLSSSITPPFVKASYLQNVQKIVFDGSAPFLALVAALQNLSGVPFIEFGNNFFTSTTEKQQYLNTNFESVNLMPLRVESFVAKCDFISFIEKKEAEQLWMLQKIQFILQIFSDKLHTIEYCSVSFPQNSEVELLLDKFIANLPIKGVKAVDYINNEVSFQAGTKPQLFLTQILPTATKLRENLISSEANGINLNDAGTHKSVAENFKESPRFDEPPAKKPNRESNSNILVDTLSLATSASDLVINSASTSTDLSQTELPKHTPTFTSPLLIREEEPKENKILCSPTKEDGKPNFPPKKGTRLLEKVSTEECEAFECTTINIGDYRWVPQQGQENLMQKVPVGFSKEGLFFEIPHILTNELIEVYIPNSYIVDIKADFSTEPCSVFISVETAYASLVRSKVGLYATLESGKYFCPNSEYACQRLIYFQQVHITENARNYLRSVFKSVLKEIQHVTAKIILYKSRCSGVHEDTLDETETLSLFASDSEGEF